MFCNECGSLLIPKKDEEGITKMMCPKCLESKNEDEEASFVIHRRISHSIKDQTLIIENDDDTLPTEEVMCSKCGNNKAFYQQIQTRSGDEAMTTFYRCTNAKCRHTWRDYGG